MTESWWRSRNEPSVFRTPSNDQTTKVSPLAYRNSQRWIRGVCVWVCACVLEMWAVESITYCVIAISTKTPYGWVLHLKKNYLHAMERRKSVWVSLSYASRFDVFIVGKNKNVIHRHEKVISTGIGADSELARRSTSTPFQWWKWKQMARLCSFSAVSFLIRIIQKAFIPHNSIGMFHSCDFHRVLVPFQSISHFWSNHQCNFDRIKKNQQKRPNGLNRFLKLEFQRVWLFFASRMSFPLFSLKDKCSMLYRATMKNDINRRTECNRKS